MTRSDQLRQALADIDSGFSMCDDDIIPDAARFALKVWEGDQQLVERVAAQLLALDLDPWHRNKHDQMARAVLAAITEEEQK